MQITGVPKLRELLSHQVEGTQDPEFSRGGKQHTRQGIFDWISN
jgi:hypothetical protein